jgi:hypothetical protein
MLWLRLNHFPGGPSRLPVTPRNVSVPVHPTQNSSWGILERLRGILACYSRPTLPTPEPFDELTLLEDFDRGILTRTVALR